MSQEQAERPADASEFKAFVGGLSWQITDEDLKEAFSKFEPLSSSVILDKNTMRPRGFGFVWFKDKIGMEDAIRDMHEQELQGRKISVVKAVPQDQTKPGTPAAHLGGGSGARGSGTMRGERYGGYDRGYGGRDRGGGYGDRGGDRGGGYGVDRYGRYPDARYAAYEGGGYRDPYARDPYAPRDPYARDPYARDPYAPRDPYAYSQDPYEARGGPERRAGGGYPPRAGPYDRPPRR